MRVIVVAAVALVGCWLLLCAVLWWRRPDEMTMRGALRFLPDVLRLLRALLADPAMPRRARWALWALLGYLALPVDLVPDVLPGIGYADDVIAVAVVLRFVVRQAGASALEQHWVGDAAGLAVVRRLAGVGATRWPRSR